MRRTRTGIRGRSVAVLLALGLTTMGTFATTAAAFDNPRSAEWHLDALHMPEVWQTSTGAGITVAVIDSGVKADVPDLVGQVLPGKDFSGLPGGPTTDADGHGTGMASIIAGSGKSFNGKGATGLAPGSKILPLRVNSTSSVSSSETLKQVDEAIDYATDNGAQIISISLAMRDVDLNSGDLTGLKTAVDYAIGKGRLIVAGAGNSGQQGNPVMYPAAMPGVAAIAAYDEQGNHTAESEYGPYIALAGPGQDIYSACTDPSGYCQSHGTSDATALTAATAAILWQVHPTWTGNQILRVLMNTANKPNDGSNRSDYIGFGNASPRNAIHYTGDPGPADVNPLIAAGIGIAPSGAASAPASAPASAAASAPATAAPTGPAASSASPAPAPVKSASGKSSSSLPLIIGGAVLAVLVIGGVAFFLVRRKRAATPPAPPAAPYGYPTPPQMPPGSNTTPAPGFGPPPAFGPGQPYGQQQSYPQQPPAQGNPYQQQPPQV
ncbi:S8 family serine peptidase [Kitasatospora kifunensis]|uniref:Type VII secretion-associated serine protease mycosin n=1 Tax=Kitasatospora kifunensis TaxID=58351 RepID=A0A7W7R271_KITKI|nr:S8 family serine peptidase [Kitasatospora kifunensis]MBB4923930.1 type VII secretion-associated serine protease mycosin [Kitasatospora kifunensis]